MTIVSAALSTLQLVEPTTHVDHAAMEDGLMTGMLYAGVLFSVVPLVVAAAFAVFLFRQLRPTSSE